MLPDWVKKFKSKSTTIKKIGNNYYLYKATSYYDPVSKKPVSIQEYVGKITPEGIKTKKILVDPSSVEVINLNLIFKTDKYDLSDIYLLKINGELYYSKLTENQLKIVKELKIYRNGKYIF